MNPENYKEHYAEPYKVEQMALIRGKCFELAELIEQVVPEGREKSLALAKTEEAMFWANAGISRKEN